MNRDLTLDEVHAKTIVDQQHAATSKELHLGRPASARTALGEVVAAGPQRRSGHDEGRTHAIGDDRHLEVVGT